MMAWNKHKGFHCSRKEGQLTWQILGKKILIASNQLVIDENIHEDNVHDAFRTWMSSKKKKVLQPVRK